MIDLMFEVVVDGVLDDLAAVDDFEAATAGCLEYHLCLKSLMPLKLHVVSVIILIEI